MAPSWSFLILLAFCLNSAKSVLQRKNVDSLSSEDILALQKALREVNEDTSEKGFAAIAAGHGYPGLCEGWGQKMACCVHGEAHFPSWHRLYVVQMEQALKDKGLNIGIPYWDWTKPLTGLPDLVNQQVYIDPAEGKARPNVWHQGDINIDGVVKHTARAVDDRLYEKVAPGQQTFLFEQIMDALEYDQICQFEVQYEVAHNTIHYLVGGRYEHSMSTLEYSSYDPIFFLHHSNLDRILVIYTQLLARRNHDKCDGQACEFCDLKPAFTPMNPFSWDSNPFQLTKTYSTPLSGADISVFGYGYDDLTLNGYTIDDLVKLIEERQSYDRSFAAFRLNGIKSSANVKVKVCVPSGHDQTQDQCEGAGDFFILGGPLEMPWWYNYPYYFDITKTVQRMGIALDSNYYVAADLFSVNGTQVPSNTIEAPYVSYRPAKGKKDAPTAHHSSKDADVIHEGIAIRKDLDYLSREEVYELREALRKFKADQSVDGYQATAEFHGEPARCPFPTANKRYACCMHGVFNFPHWHRLFVVQIEDALRRRGLNMGLPYWDWNKPTAALPEIAKDPTYIDPHTGEEKQNPFYDSAVGFLGQGIRTTRDPIPALPPPAFGDHTILFDAMLHAFEQDNFCDFEVQMEIIHNAIHASIGGSAPFSMSTLGYSAFDPLFYLHHSGVDRLWAIWTGLQEYRGLPYKAHCGQSYMYEPLKPFAFSSPLNNNEKTFAHSVPTNIDDYEKELGYSFESLEFGGMSIPELDAYINKYLKTRNRVFVGGLMYGTGDSGTMKVFIKGGGADKYFAGMFAILGGPSEMPWRMDRQFRLDITNALEALGLTFTDPWELIFEGADMNGTATTFTGPFPRPTVIYRKAEKPTDRDAPDHITRKNVEQMTREEIYELRQAMAKLQADSSPGGFQDLGRYHGSPKWCEHNGKKVACCLHGMPAFPHWHRLWTVQAENALRRNGYKGALPYWDWTSPLTALPELVANPTYVDPKSHAETPNSFYSGPIADAGASTVRSVSDKLYDQPAFGEYTPVARQVMYALEQDNFCDFEVQFEISHNFIHALIGGSETYSMASLEYTAYDPIFYLHHSNTDRNWAVWQALQKYRGKSFNTANCAITQMRNPMPPFSMSSSVNPDAETRDHSRPYQVFDYHANFHYHYDNLDFNGLSISQLARVLEHNKEQDRVFAGFVLHGIKQSALVKFYICRPEDDCNNFAGEFYVLGADAEMPWAYDRLYKYEITQELEKLGIRYNDKYHLRYEAIDLAGNVISTDAFPQPSVLYEPGTKRIQGQDYQTHASEVRKNLDDLTEGEMESLRSAFRSIQKDGTYEQIASFHGKPGLCQLNGSPIACCVHGMPTFPAWHRLYVEQVEEALLGRGSAIAVPYWDWTKPITKLPDLINKATYFDSREQKFQPNPFFSGKVAGEDAVTTRDPQPELFNNDYFNEQALYALEQTNFCDFEIQFEIIHNALHSWLGGRATYSMSSLDYSAFDPVFFLHHANTDRLWAIWQELQKYRGLPYNEADCAINLMRAPLKPFNDEALNSGDYTQRYSRPADTFDYRNHFHYEYDNLEYNGMNIAQLDNLLTNRQKHGRVFAGFLLHNIGMSADVDIYVCIPTGEKGKENCKTKAGTFSILGGELEMPFTFDRLYKYEITDTVRELGLRLDSAVEFALKIDIKGVNGSYLSNDAIPKPTISFVPGTDDAIDDKGKVASYLVRKEIKSLSPPEEYSLVKAMRSLQADSSGDGYQSIASFHALPPLCPSPDAAKRWACCRHGMASFPQWHRLYTVQAEDALRRHGAYVGLPYWDWTRVSDSLPAFFNDPTVFDPVTGEPQDNPWYKAHIDFANVDTERDVMGDYLFQRGAKGWDSWLFNQAVFALEQEDYCDFEIQFEILHNAIHSWLGGSKEYSVGHLHYASYDPVFYIHHSNTDRLWAVWQALQEYRGKSGNEANCALKQMRDPLKPFSFGPPYNLNPVTYEYSRPEDTFDYKDHFNYRYDNLDFNGMSMSRLDAFIKERQERDRVFAGFLLKGFGSSALVDFEVCRGADNCFPAGYFTVLGGSAEMPWHFDRLYKYEITDVLEANGVRFDDEYDIHVHVKYIDGTELDSSVIPTPSVLVERAHKDHGPRKVTPNHVRRNVESLSKRDVSSLAAALRSLMEDESPDGWNAIASFHYQPGSPNWLFWNRLYLLQVEKALRRHGSSIALPYWDWLPTTVTSLPELLTKEEYYDVWKDEVVKNPFVRGYIPAADTYTVRQPNELFFHNPWNSTWKPLAHVAGAALGAKDICEFTVQAEIVSNAARCLVGGYSKYSLFSWEYGQFDPAILLIQTLIDKLWVNWQEIQKVNGNQWNTADCALTYLNKGLAPFDDPNVNFNPWTREHAYPKDLFDIEDLGYAYDNFDLGGMTLEQGMRAYEYVETLPRVFLGFLIKGVGHNQVNLAQICPRGKACFGGNANIVIGGPSENPWSYDRLFKADITIPLQLAGISPESVFDPNPPFTVHMTYLDGSAQPAAAPQPPPTLIYVPPKGASEVVASSSVAGVGVRKEVSSLTESEIKNLRHALQRVKDDHGPNGFHSIASMHGAPPTRCTWEGQPIACCLHGMPNFPHWHRLYMKQWEDALTAHGANIGIPYWDWTKAFTSLPSLVTDPVDNPFLSGTTPDGHVTSRAPRPELFNDPEFGSTSFFYRQALLMFEQTDYCDFEVQYEITHNAIHSWTGGRSVYGMSTLEYTSYDPLFVIHHSNVDRQLAIWQALQKFRGLPYNTANCAIQHLKRPMRPFSDEDNVNPTTRANCRASDAFDYNRLNYQYDNLNFHGLTISQLNDVLEDRKKEDRIFAEFLLAGFKASADVRFDLCDEEGHCEFAGTFAVLGGPLEMPWAFDRLFKYDVTKAFKKLSLRPDGDYHFDVHIVCVNGTELNSKLIGDPAVHFVPGVEGDKHKHVVKHVEKTTGLVRKEVNQLTLSEVTDLKNALNKLQQDSGPNGYEAIAGFHGYPFKCPENGDDKYACCVHGMPNFPHWHRLLTLQFEQALQEKGSRVGVPYWDWTIPAVSLPPLFGDDSNGNPFHHYAISGNGKKTERNVSSELFNAKDMNGYPRIFYLALTALEEDNYCDFEVAFEVLHNELHAVIGGQAMYSMTTLDYSAFDPYFMIHHSATDRLWTIWQELQKLRRKPFNVARCAGRVMERPLHPFSYPSVNKNDFTRLNSVPNAVFDSSRLGYTYDKLELNGYDVNELHELLQSLRSQTRYYALFTMFGIKTSCYIQGYLSDGNGHEHAAMKVHILGSQKEIPWAYERIYRYDVTSYVREHGLDLDHPVSGRLDIALHNGHTLNSAPMKMFFVKRPANANYEVVIIPFNRDNMLVPKLVLKKGSRVKFVSDDLDVPIENLGSYTTFNQCTVPPFSFNTYNIGQEYELPPGDYFFTPKSTDLCKAGRRIQVTVDEE